MKKRLGTWIDSLDAASLELLHTDWTLWASEQQRPPSAGAWRLWLILGGRGAGKTRAGAEWIRSRLEGRTPLAKGRCRNVALVAESYADAREIMIEGPSGLRSIAAQSFRPTFQSSRRRLVWPNGGMAYCFSAQDPEGLRGMQFDSAWSDELCKWNHAKACWDNLQFALRLGENPQQVATTTPKNTALIKQLVQAKTTCVTRISTHDNASNLSCGFLDHVLALYGQSALGRQEIYGEIVEEDATRLWNLVDIDRARVRQIPEDLRIVIALDPAVTGKSGSDATGIIVVGSKKQADEKTHFYILEDATLQMAAPPVWAKRVIDLYHRYKAIRIVAEVNQGGDMIESILHQYDPSISVYAVRAQQSKHRRAEPVAVLYAQERVHHVGYFAALEDQLCSFEDCPKSPDRADALIWGIFYLMQKTALPRIRML